MLTFREVTDAARKIDATADGQREPEETADAAFAVWYARTMGHPRALRAVRGDPGAAPAHVRQVRVARGRPARHGTGTGTGTGPMVLATLREAAHLTVTVDGVAVT